MYNGKYIYAWCVNVGCKIKHTWTGGTFELKLKIKFSLTQSLCISDWSLETVFKLGEKFRIFKENFSGKKKSSDRIFFIYWYKIQERSVSIYNHNYIYIYDGWKWWVPIVMVVLNDIVAAVWEKVINSH